MSYIKNTTEFLIDLPSLSVLYSLMHLTPNHILCNAHTMFCYFAKVVSCLLFIVRDLNEWWLSPVHACVSPSLSSGHRSASRITERARCTSAHVRECSLIKFTNRSSARRNWRSRAVTNSVFHFSPEWSFECDAIHAQSVREFLSEIALDKL